MDAAALPLDLEDDIFFADLSKQISLLIMDDDDQDSLAHCQSVNLQAFTQIVHPTRQTTHFDYDRQTCKRESKGTGVFIPRSPHPRRKNAKQGKSRASGNRAERPSQHNSMGIPHMAYNNSICSSYQSINHRTY